MEGTYQYISTQDGLAELYTRMAHTDVYAIDTEFIKVNTLYPRLGLLQINVDGHIYLLDGQSLVLDDLWILLFNARQNILHACSEDIDLIHHYASQRALDNIFDTQIGLSFLDHGLQLSYQQALLQELGLSIDKGETRSDWLARPLRPEQLHYAATDVLHLPELAATIKRQLLERGTLEMAVEDCRTLARDIATDLPLAELYQDVATFKHSRQQLAQLQQLCVWREQIARATNQPRSFILKNAILLQLVEKQPINLYQLQRIPELRPAVIREHGKTILDLLRYLPDTDQWPARLPRPFRQRNQDLQDSIYIYVGQVAYELNIPAEVMFRKKWLQPLLLQVAIGGNEEKLPSALLGWRYDLLTRPLLNGLSSHRDLLQIEMAPLPDMLVV